MPNRKVLDKLSIYIPKSKTEDRLVQRLLTLGKKRNRSVNYLVVEAILEFVEKEEKRDATG